MPPRFTPEQIAAQKLHERAVQDNITSRNRWALTTYIARCAGGWAMVEAKSLNHLWREYADMKQLPLDTVPAEPVVTQLSGPSWVPEALLKIKRDFTSTLNRMPFEVPGLLKELRAGHINGSKYTGACSCLVGTLMRLQHGTAYMAERPLFDAARAAGLDPDVSNPSEAWFLAIRRGSTPKNNIIARYVEDWILEWQALRKPVAVPLEPKFKEFSPRRKSARRSHDPK